MTEEEKKLLLVDISARLPYGVKGLHRKQVHSITIMDASGLYPSLQVDSYNAWFPIETFKPYLRLLSSMTAEEKEEWKKTFDAVYDYVPGENEDDDNIVGWHDEPGIESYDWLNAHHFDYRGLIEKGLALEAPEGMYK